MATSTHSCQDKINCNIIHNDIVEKINFDMNVTTTPLTKKPGISPNKFHIWKSGQRQLGKHASIFALRSQPLFRWTQPWSSTARTTIGYNWIKHGYSPENEHIPWEMMVGRWTFLLKWSLLGRHVNFWEGKHSNQANQPFLSIEYRKVYKNVSLAIPRKGNHMNEEVRSSAMQNLVVRPDSQRSFWFRNSWRFFNSPWKRKWQTSHRTSWYSPFQSLYIYIFSFERFSVQIAQTSRITLIVTSILSCWLVHDGHPKCTWNLLITVSLEILAFLWRRGWIPEIEVKEVPNILTSLIYHFDKINLHNIYDIFNKYIMTYVKKHVKIRHTACYIPEKPNHQGQLTSAGDPQLLR